MRLLFVTIIVSLFASCADKKTPILNPTVSQLSKADSTALMKELLGTMRSNVRQSLDEYCELQKNYTPPTCSDWYRGCEIKTNGQGEIVIRGQRAQQSDIIDAVYLYYTSNMDLTEMETEHKLTDFEYEFVNNPFYSYINLRKVQELIKREYTLMAEAKKVGADDIVEIHEKSIADSKKIVQLLKITGRKEINMIHSQVHIKIDNYFDCSGLSEEADICIAAMYRVRNKAAWKYFQMSYLDIYLKFKQTHRKRFKDQLMAIETLYPLRIIDEPYLCSINCIQAIMPLEEEILEQ